MIGLCCLRTNGIGASGMKMMIGAAGGARLSLGIIEGTCELKKKGRVMSMSFKT